MESNARSVGEIEGFIDLLRTACEDESMNRTLTKLLTQPADLRRRMVLWLVNDMSQRRAPIALMEAVACLVDDGVAEQAHGVLQSHHP